MTRGHIYTGYSSGMPAAPGRITPDWVKFPCVVCGTDTWIGPTQVAHKAQHGGDVVCPLCLARGGGRSENVVNLDDRLGQPHTPADAPVDPAAADPAASSSPGGFNFNDPNIALGRTLDDGRVLYVNPLFCGEARICLGDECCIHEAWYYETLDLALAAYVQWQPDVEPTGWYRHIPSHRRREHGDPTKECIRP